VLRFGALLAFIMLGAKWISQLFGTGGLLSLAAISGAADVDPITLSMAQSAGHGVEFDYAVLAILIALAANTATKCVLAVMFGGPRFGLPLIGVAVAAAGATAVTFHGLL